jgi:hypothetical protein
LNFRNSNFLIFFQQIILHDLRAKHGYSLQIRAINARGEISDFTQPPLLFRTLDEHQQQGGGGGISEMMAKDGAITQSTIVAMCIGFVGLLLLNCVLICYLNRRNKLRRMQGEQHKKILGDNAVDLISGLRWIKFRSSGVMIIKYIR